MGLKENNLEATVKIVNMTATQAQAGADAISILQQLMWGMGVVRRDIVLSDGELIEIANGVLAGTNRPITDPVEGVREILKYCGEDPNREGLRETPERFLKAMKFYTSGYGQDPAAVMKTFEDGAEAYDEMVVQTGITFHSLCEHHLAPFYGEINIGYVANGRVIGLSKLARISDIYARRFQVQERLTVQIADCLEKHLKPLGVAVLIEARHLCIECRGVQKIGSVTTTCAVRGVLKEKPEARAEFMAIVKSRRK